jgi:hypothetical protein
VSRPALRAVAVAGVAALTLAAPATAFAASHGHAHQAKAKSHSSHKHHGKPAPAKFTAVGTVTAVDPTGGTITLADKGGSKDLHGKSVTVTVSPSTKVTRDDAPSSLSSVQVGDHVAANGTRADGGVLNAKHVNAESAPQPEPSESSSPEPQPTETAASTGV